MTWEQLNDKEELLDHGVVIINKLDETLTCQLGDKYQWEWRSVVGDCFDGKPIWSLTLYVEPKEEEQDE